MTQSCTPSPPLIAKQIRYYRRLRDLTQKELAVRIGVLQPAVQRWETGEKLPRTDTLPRLAQALGIPIGKLFDALPREVS